jgi:hypothetical protein
MRTIALVFLLASTGSAQTVIWDDREVAQAYSIENEGYLVTVDKPVSKSYDGTPVLARGTTLTVVPKETRLTYWVWLVGPEGAFSWRVRGSRALSLNAPGGYRLKLGREEAKVQTPLTFIVASGS